MVPFERAFVTTYKHFIHIISVSAIFARNFRLQFSVGVANPNFGEGEAVGGQGWYRSKERW